MKTIRATLLPGLWKFAFLCSLCLSAGCGTLREGRGWGQDAIYPVQWKRIPQAAKRALLDPITWVSTAGALVFSIDDFDERTSDWAVKQQPVFGSRDSALEASDVLVDALRAETLATALLTPSGDDPLDWSLAKVKGIAVEYGALRATGFSTSLIKDAAGRTRPDLSDDKSFPSGHTSTAFAGARLSNRNLDSIDLPAWVRTPLKAGNVAMAGTVAWARVEGQKHFPSDVLAGAALGNFVTTFLHDAFLNLPEDNRFSFYIEPSLQGVWAVVAWEF